MPTLEQLASDEAIRNEYKKSFLLNIFRKLCVRMARDENKRVKIRTLYRESRNSIQTTKIIVNREFDYTLEQDEAIVFLTWMNANLSKKDYRRAIPLDVKKHLYDEQQGRCAVCGELLGDNWTKIHVDHIIPWTLVGDELDDNYQDLCEFCNESKSSRTDYIFKKMINLN